MKVEPLRKEKIKTVILEQRWSCVGLFNVEMYLTGDINLNFYFYRRFMETHLRTIPSEAFSNLPNISRM